MVDYLEENQNLRGFQKRYLKILEKRAEHLHKRIAESARKNPEKHLSYDEAELSALRWVIAFVVKNSNTYKID